VACLVGLLTIAGASLSARAREVVTFTEADLDGHTRPVADGGVVDINSTLNVRTNVEELYRQSGGTTDSVSVLTVLLNPLLKLQAGVGAGAANVASLQEALAAWAAAGRDTLGWVGVRGALRKAAEPVAKILAATQGTPFAARLDQALDLAPRTSIAEQYALVFASLDAEIATLTARRDQLAKEAGISLRAGAWLRGETSDVPVHLEGFDRYPERDEVVVTRWRIALTEEERRQLRASVRFSQALNQGDLGRPLADGFATAVRHLLDLAEPCTASFQEALVGFRNRVGQSAEPVKSAVLNALEKTQRLRTSALELRAKYGERGTTPSSDPESLLLGTNDDLVTLTGSVGEAVAAIQDLKRIARQTATNATMSAVLKPLLDWAPDDCTTSLANVQQSGQDMARQCLGALGLRHRNNSLLTFGEDVLALDLANVPVESTVRIPRMGPRAPGDVVEVRLSAARANVSPHDIQRTRITLRRVLPHLEIAVGLVFARADSSARPRSVFQTAPAYSILIKGWPMRNYHHSNLLDCGVGLNLAALDFNHDDSQELGIGVVLSGLLENLMQVGYGYNVKAGVPYAFFGLRLPLPDFGINRPKAEASPVE